MVTAGRTPSERALIVFTYESGLRNSTARAVRYGDIQDELGSGLDVVHVPVRSSMKEVDPDAAKGRLEYDPFIGREAVTAVKGSRRLRGGDEREALPAWIAPPARTADDRDTPEEVLPGRDSEEARKDRGNREVEGRQPPHCLRKAFLAQSTDCKQAFSIC